MGTIDYGQWNHYAITRTGNIFRTFKNGTKVSEWTSPKPITRSTRDGTLKFSIGRSQGSDYFKGYIDGLRVTKGTSLYTSNFTAPTTELSTTSTTGLYNGEHYVESVYSAINTVSEQLGTEYRVNTTGTLDAGLKDVLFEGHGTNEPPAIIVRDVSGEDPAISGLTPEQITAQFDAEDYVSGVELLTQTEGSSQQADHAEAFDNNIPYKDLFGADLERVQFVGENNIPNIQRTDRAQAYLNEFKKVKKTLSLSLEEYDLQGDFSVGDMIYVYDPEIRFEDTEAKRIEDGRSSLFEVAYRGQIINPEKIRITGITWPVKDGYGVYLRKVASSSPYRVEYIDLSDYVSWESGNTQLDIGDLQKRIGEDLRFSSAVTGVVSGTRQTGVRKPRHPDTLVEGDLKLTSATVQDDLGRDNAIIFVQWEEPTYDNGSPVQNGLQYQIEWKPSNTTGDYQSSFVTWSSTNDFTIEGLQLNTSYDVRVIAILTNANSSDPATGTVTTALDTNAPSKPGPAATIAAGALRVQIVHNLGRAEDDNGNAIGSIVDFTLERDTHHLNVYASTTSGFSLSSANDKEQHKVGELNVGSASIKHQIPVVGEIQMPNGSTHYFRFTAVDNAGNESNPSDEQSANGNLVATANISDAAITTAKINNLAVTDAKIDTLNAGKITAGTISGQEIIVGTNTSDSAVIKSSNYSTGSAGWKIDSDGTVEFESGTFRGNLDGAGGTFSGTISANQVTGGTLDFNSVTAGNLDFSSLSVQAGDIVAEIAAGEITDSLIGGVSVGKLTAGSIVGNSITLGSGSDTSGSISSHNFSSGSTGFQIQYDGDAFFNSVTVNNPIITLNSASSNNESNVSSSVLGIGGARIYENSNDLYLRGTSIVLQDSNGGSEANPSVTFSTSFDNPGFYAENDNFNTQAKLYWSSGSNNIIHSESDYDTLYIDAANIAIGTDTGTANEFIGKNSSGQLGWHTVSSASHTHTESDISNIGAHNHSIGEISGHGSHLSLGASGGINGSSGNAARFDHSHSGVGSHSHTANDVTGTISVTSVSSGGFVNSLSYNNSNKTLTVAGSNTRNANISTRTHTPTANLSYNLGGFGQVWATVFRNGESTGSDERLKNSIEDIDKGLDFINDLQPRKFKWNNDSIGFFCDVCDVDLEDASDTCDTEDCEGTSIERFTMESERDKWQYGFIAQELLTNLDSNTSYGIANYDETEDNYFYSPTNLVAVLTKAVQELSTQISDLTARIEALEG